jgi:eukaryotic-like serine/threonine-protein kinase
MPAPSTVEEFVDLVRRSAVLDEPRLTSYVQKLKADSATPKDLSSLAGLFVRDGLLTYFQAEQFLQGKWKRFTIGKYKVLEKLGSGGMGQVFLCEHKLMRRRVAVKVLPTAKAADPSSLERFYREARAVAALDHVNIVRAYDIDQDDNLHFLVMEYVDGASMQDMIRKGGKMDVLRACHYMYWSAIGLQHAHAAGLIHRDIKPGNILVDRQGIVKILDLGLARFFNDDQDMLTKQYDETVLGTADYLAPEQAIDSHTVDGRADIYSLGATFYFLLTGGPPFAEGSVAQKLLWHQTRTPKPIREVRQEVPPEVAAILEKMMAKKPDDRYATPAQLADALLPFTQTPIGPPPEVEMPLLSAAAMGTSSAPSMVAAVQRTMPPAPRTPQPTPGQAAVTSQQPGSKPTTKAKPKPPASKPAPAPGPKVAVADADTQRNKPVPVIEPIPDSVPGAPIWESISAETANAARADTDRRNRDGKSNRRYTTAPADSRDAVPTTDGPRSNRRKAKKPLPILLILLLAAGVLVVGGGAFAAYWFGIRDKPTHAANQGTTEPKTLFLSKTAGKTPNHFATLSEALKEFHPGDTIVILDDVWEEYGAATRTRGLVLTSAEGKRVVWRAPSNLKGPQDRALLAISSAEGARISGITFDAGGQAANGIRLHGACPGLILEDVDLLDARVASLVVEDCVGQSGRPVTIRKVRFFNGPGKDCQAAVRFTANPPAKAGGVAPGNQVVHFQGCVIDGAIASGFQFEGTASAIDLRHCRVKTGNGLLFKKLDKPAEVVWRVDVTNNTFLTPAGFGVRCEDAVQIKAKPENQITFKQNFFIGNPAQIDGDATNAKFLISENLGNFRKAGSPPGPLVTAELQLPTELPAEGANILIYDKDNPLNTAFNGKAVGAPPE